MIQRSCIAIIILCGYLHARAIEHHPSVHSLLGSFDRKITLLEIGLKTAPLSIELASGQKAVCVALVTQGSSLLMNDIFRLQLNSIIVLAPPMLSLVNLQRLGACEHFDVVVVHDPEQLIACAHRDLMSALLRLGDYLFIETQSSSFQHELIRKGGTALQAGYEKVKLYSFRTPKKQLECARFTQKKGRTIKNYRIISTFKEKFFMKEGLERPIRWIPGINLVSFCMLNGMYPTDDILRAQLLKMKKIVPYHTDLVLGNILVQGDALIPIDGTDKRRNANISICLTAAVRAFRDGNKRLVDPQKWIDEYYTGLKVTI